LSSSPLLQPDGPVTARWQVLTTDAEVEAICADWDDLGRRAEQYELTRSPDWLLPWWRIYGPSQGRKLRVGLLFRDERLTGLAPLLRRRCWHGPIPFQRLELLGSGEPEAEAVCSNHLGIVAEHGAERYVAEELVRAVAEGLFGHWDELVFSMMSGNGPLADQLVQSFHDRGLLVEQKQMALAPYLVLPSTWEEYLKGLSTNGRRRITRSRKALDQWSEGTLRFERVSNTDDIDKGRKLLIDLHHARWATEEQGGVFRSPLFLRFHDAMMRQLVERGQLVLWWLSIGDEPIAVLYGMEWGGKIYAYQMGRRIDLPAHLRPGGVLLDLAIQEAITSGCREFDLLADAVPYKWQLTDESRPLWYVRVARHGWREQIRNLARRCIAFGRNVRSKLMPSAPSRVLEDASVEHTIPADALSWLCTRITAWAFYMVRPGRLLNTHET
jgi:CelD/BcsL family acetyltransferase involved in cellulose biosynthesis